VRVLRQTLCSTSGHETIAELPPGFNRNDPGSASRLSRALLLDTLRDEIRVLRLEQPVADLLTSRLLPFSTWILTNVDIEAAVQAIEELQGWLWLDEGHYLDQDPRLGAGYVHGFV
jgi:hypothetical protein